ncbi:MAG TPA: lysylphosphatidylglycerol synthase transmembrane domain-containing protein [Bryobacteraceae bacterium]|nr:lysylphosphatidylglycerol synthase transmembrane domain-containing protein [Bryobacteraceae bacterium]
MRTKAWARKPVTVILVVLAATLAAVFIYWRVTQSDFDAERFWNTFTNLHVGWLSLGGALVLLTYVGRALRWQVMMRPFVPHARFGKLLSATVIGFTGIVLFGRPGELIRPYLIANRERTSFSSQMAIWLLERIWDLLTVLALFGYALTQVKVDPSQVSSSMQWILRTGGILVAALCTVCVAMLLAISVFSDAAQRRIRAAMPAIPERFRERVENVLISFAGGMECTRSIGSTGLIFFYSVLEWIVIVVGTWCLLRSFPQTAAFSVVDTAVFVGFIAFGSIVQIPGIGGGMQVASIIVLTELFGLDLASATGAAVLIWLSMYVFVTPIGILLAIHEGVKWKEVSHLEAETLP